MNVKIIKLKMATRCAECGNYIIRERNSIRLCYKNGFSNGTYHPLCFNNFLQRGIKLYDDNFTVEENIEKEKLPNANSAWKVFKRIYQKMKIGDIIGFRIRRKHFSIIRDKN